jgi:hypothetical protein
MTRNYMPYRHQPFQSYRLPSQPAPHWWRPLTRWWGIIGVIIFVGLVMRLMDNVGFPRTMRHAPVSGGHATSASQIEQILRPPR